MECIDCVDACIHEVDALQKIQIPWDHPLHLSWFPVFDWESIAQGFALFFKMIGAKIRWNDFYLMSFRISEFRFESSDIRIILNDEP